MQRISYRGGFAGLSFANPVHRLDPIVDTNWRHVVPVLSSAHVVLRELRAADAASLFAMLTAQEVARFISAPPSTVEGFERFIAWAQRQRAAGTYVCFAVTLPASDTAIGLLQVRALDKDFSTAEWGFVLASRYWGSGVFVEAANLAMAFAFETLGVFRLEARAALRNGRGNAALLKIGAVPEATLRESFLCNGERLDQMLYAIVHDDWRASQAPEWGRVAMNLTVH